MPDAPTETPPDGRPGARPGYAQDTCDRDPSPSAKRLREAARRSSDSADALLDNAECCREEARNSKDAGVTEAINALADARITLAHAYAIEEWCLQELAKAFERAAP